MSSWSRSIASPGRRARGRRVSSATVSELLDRDGPAQGSLHAHGGMVLGADGKGVADAWVVLPALGLGTTTGTDGRFVFAAVPAGEHEILARAADGATTSATMTVPGRAPLLRFGAAP